MTTSYVISGPKRYDLLNLAVGVVALAGFGLTIVNICMAGALENRMSMDTTPIRISIDDITYQIPRNYLFQMDNWDDEKQGLISLRVQYPGFRPFEAETRACFLHKRECHLIEFHLELRNILSTEAAFNNEKSLFKSQMPENGPYGFEIYTFGPKSARVDVYRKILSDRVIIFQCYEGGADQNNDSGICQSYTRTRTGGQISYFFPRRLLADAEAINSGLRDLTDSFADGAIK